MNRAVMLFGALVVCSASGIAQEAKEADRWNAWQFLVGEWIGESIPRSGTGEGSGTFSFNFDLEGKILVRKNRAEYAGRGGTPAGALWVPGGGLVRGLRQEPLRIEVPRGARLCGEESRQSEEQSTVNSSQFADRRSAHC